MHRQTVKDEYISCVNLAANPIIPLRCSLWNFWNMEVFRVVTLNTEAMRAIQNLQWALICWAIMKRNPDGETLSISIHELEILMRVIHETFAMRKNQPTNWFGMDQDSLTHKHAHDLLQSGMMRQGVKRFEIKDFLVGPFE